MRDAYYFGCVSGAGHYFFDGLGLIHRNPGCPWTAAEIDGKLQPGCVIQHERWQTPREQPQGAALLHYKDGWTALSFWDRSVDRRLGSNSTFMFRGEHDFDALVKLAQERFPTIWSRYSFPVIAWRAEYGHRQRRFT